MGPESCVLGRKPHQTCAVGFQKAITAYLAFPGRRGKALYAARWSISPNSQARLLVGRIYAAAAMWPRPGSVIGDCTRRARFVKESLKSSLPVIRRLAILQNGTLYCIVRGVCLGNSAGMDSHPFSTWSIDSPRSSWGKRWVAFGDRDRNRAVLVEKSDSGPKISGAVYPPWGIPLFGVRNQRYGIP